MKTIFTAMTALALFSGAAVAADAYPKGSTKDAQAAFDGVPTYNWSGVYVSGGVGYGVGTLNDEDSQGGISASGFQGSGRLGVDLARGHFLFGVFGEYGLSGQALEVASGTFTVVEKESEWNIGGRLGLIDGPTLFYVLGTYGQKHYATSTGDDDLDAWGLGLGIEHQVAKNFSLGLEIKRDWVDVTKYSDDASVVDNAVLARATYRINSSTFGF